VAKKEKDSKADPKKDGGKKGRKEATPYSSIATHPRARTSVRRAKAWTGLIAFAITAALSLKAGVPAFQTGLRALAAGVAGYMLAWWFSMMIWRQLMLAEQKVAVEEIERRRAEDAEKEPAEAQAAG
jgi:hypothetical protein